MKRRTHIAVIAGALAAVAVTAAAQPQTLPKGIKQTFSTGQKYPILPGGSFVLENGTGNIQIIGGEGTEIEATTTTTIVGVHAAALEEGRKRSTVIVGGDDKARVLRANVTPRPGEGWTVSVDWYVKVPRGTFLRIVSLNSSKVAVHNMAGSIHVKSYRGNVLVMNSTGDTMVENTNGNIAFSTTALNSNVVLSTVNGSVTANVPQSADFRWVAETIRGDIRTNLPARGAFIGNTYRGTVNAPGGPTLTMATLMGNVLLVGDGSGMTNTHSLIKERPEIVPRMDGILQRETVKGLFRYQTNLGDVRVSQVDGDVDIFTGSGKVQLGMVTGSAKVISKGGPLHFGEILGRVDASTVAGDILIDTMRSGGTLHTKGGTIRVLYTSGPTQIVSSGGDIIVRQTKAPLRAETTSGDITVTIDRNSKSETIDATTFKGNIVVYLNRKLAADIDATILTDRPDDHSILSDLPGLAISKSQQGTKTRIRATGKINGGGQLITLQASGGDIRISTAEPGPTVIRSK